MPGATIARAAARDTGPSSRAHSCWRSQSLGGLPQRFFSRGNSSPALFTTRSTPTEGQLAASTASAPRPRRSSSGSTATAPVRSPVRSSSATVPVPPSCPCRYRRLRQPSRPKPSFSHGPPACRPRHHRASEIRVPHAASGFGSRASLAALERPVLDANFSASGSGGTGPRLAPRSTSDRVHVELAGHPASALCIRC